MANLIRDFFQANQAIMIFGFGQIFFILGLTIACQSWHHSRLGLARSLKWLAAFGLSHGLQAWGQVFIPLQAEYLAPALITLLRVGQVTLLAISFACLFQFGVENLRPLPARQHWVRYGPALALLVWVFIVASAALSAGGLSPAWYGLANIWARYSLGFPGALLAAYGLRTQAQRLIAPVALPYFWRALQVAGLALASYAFIGGLVGPPADFFPANRLNSGLVERWTLLPIEFYGGLVGLVLMVAILRAFEVFRVELDRRLSQMEESQVLIAERERIGRELHDGTLQTIYAAGLLLRTTEKALTQPPGLAHLQQSIALLDEAVADIRRYIGALRPQPSSQSLARSLAELAAADHLRSLVEVELDLNLPEDQALSPAQVGHLLAIVNESLSNVVRHAQATRLQLQATVIEGRLVLRIGDNGRGFPRDYVVGYGLRNMRDRTRLLGGEMSVETKAGHGSAITIKLPWGEAYENVTNFTG
jgi:signal transduction histidine kinase